MQIKKSFLTIIGDRSQLSMLGKGIIGLIGGIVMIFVTLSRNSNKNEQNIFSDKVSWVEKSIIDPATLPNASIRSEYFKVKVANEMSEDSFISFINDRCKGGSLTQELNRHDLDSLSNHFKELNSFRDTSNWVFYINSPSNTDFLLIIKDSAIVETLSL